MTGPGGVRGAILVEAILLTGGLLVPLYLSHLEITHRLSLRLKELETSRMVDDGEIGWVGEPSPVGAGSGGLD